MSSVITFLVTSPIICFDTDESRVLFCVGVASSSFVDLVVILLVFVVFITLCAIQSSIVAPSLCLRPLLTQLLLQSAGFFVLAAVVLWLIIICIGKINKNANIILWSGGAATASTILVLPFALRTRHLLSHIGGVFLGVSRLVVVVCWQSVV